jgi:hypothetical protein
VAADSDLVRRRISRDSWQSTRTEGARGLAPGQRGCIPAQPGLAAGPTACHRGKVLVEVDGTRLWFDVDGPALVPDGRPSGSRTGQPGQDDQATSPTLMVVGPRDPVTPLGAAEEVVTRALCSRPRLRPCRMLTLQLGPVGSGHLGGPNVNRRPNRSCRPVPLHLEQG